MFDYVDMLQGPSAGAVDSDEEDGGQAPDQAQPAQAAEAAGQPSGAFNLWGMATALAEGVKKSTADIAARCAGVGHACSLPAASRQAL